MDSSEHKKINLEDLSKDDLLKRCKGLISIVQKLKASKVELEEENVILKQHNIQTPNEVTEEVLQKLTEEKLTLVIQIDNLKQKNLNLEKRIQINEQLEKEVNILQIENISYGRQVARLTDENEQLLSDLATLEAQITTLNNLGLQQQQQLLELEKRNDVKLTETENKLSVSLLEIEKLKATLISKESEINQLPNEIEHLKHINKTLTSKENDLNSEIVGKLKLDNEAYCKELVNVNKLNQNLKDKLGNYHSKLKKFALTTKEIKQEKNEIIKSFKAYTEQIKDWKVQLYNGSKNLIKVINELETENKSLRAYKNECQCDELKQKHLFYEKQLKSLEEKICEEVEKNKYDQNNSFIENKKQWQDLQEQFHIKENEYKEEITKLNSALEKSLNTETQLAEKSSEEILRLASGNRDLQNKVTDLENELFKINCKSHECVMVQTEEMVHVGEKGIDLKRENSELLLEMNQMNQVLKERGEIISKLEAHCEEVKKKLQLHETQANRNVDDLAEKEETIRKLTSEIESLKHKNSSYIDTSYAESETMSTSTISRMDESNRLKDLEGPWEERYGKLRTLAIKLKAKIKEQSAIIGQIQLEKEELYKKVSNNVKTIQNLQEQIDKHQDELDQVNTNNKQYLNKLNSVAENISKDKQLLVEKDEEISKLNKDLQQLTIEKESLEDWKKRIAAKVQTLRKELEAKNLIIKDCEFSISKLENELKQREHELKLEQDNHKQTKNILDETNGMVKKNSLLNLEMQDYEKTVKELSIKVEKQKSDTENLQSQLEMQRGTVDALREQNKALEEQRQETEKKNNASFAEVNSYKKAVIDLENVLQQKENKILDLVKIVESARSENEELSTELSKVIAEHQKSLNSLKLERDQLRNHTSSIQQNLREALDELRMKDDELKSIKDDYDTYKVRAQSVLKKNQSRDLGLEEKLVEEVTTIKTQNSELQNELKITKDLLQNVYLNNDELTKKAEKSTKKYQELEVELEELKTYNDKLCEKHQKIVIEHGETVRNLKVHADTLSQCYRQQLSEQEIRHNREIIEMQSRLDKVPSPVETPIHPNMPREEGEGSESIEIQQPNKVHPVPLERLLDSKSDDETQSIKKQLFEQESKVVHLTALLSDTEQDLAKHVQMNKLLKDEIRRHQRSLEREQHAENLEYLKNVVLKFVTLNSGDERTRLVPVLNTILKLSPEETRKLNMVAKGDPGIKAWTSYLPLWSSPSKPQ